MPFPSSWMEENRVCREGGMTNGDYSCYSEKKSSGTMKTSPFSGKSNRNSQITEKPPNQKPLFMPAKDDTKPLLQDPILRSDPIKTEEAVLRLPPLSITRSSSPSNVA